MKNAVLIGLIALAVFVSGCTQSQPPASDQIFQPPVRDYCQSSSDSLLIQDNILTENGWNISFANNSEKSFLNPSVSISTNPTITNETISISVPLSQSKDIPFGSWADIVTSGNYASNQKYTTEITVEYQQDGATQQVKISCTGTA